MKARVSTERATLDSGRGFIFTGTPDGTPWNVEFFAYDGCNYCAMKQKANLNIGADIALVGVWKGSQFAIENFCDPRNWEP